VILQQYEAYMREANEHVDEQTMDIDPADMDVDTQS
jgi:hypothetical protein